MISDVKIKNGYVNKDALLLKTIPTQEALAMAVAAQRINGAYIKEWISSDAQPTVSAIEAAEVLWQAAYDGQAYARARKAKYDLLNQDEMRYDDTKNSTTTWVDAIDAIKVAHPKP